MNGERTRVIKTISFQKSIKENNFPPIKEVVKPIYGNFAGKLNVLPFFTN